MAPRSEARSALSAQRMTEPPQLIEARRLKALGNEEFKAGNYKAATRHYHQVGTTFTEAAAVVLMLTWLQIWLQVHGLDGAAPTGFEAFNNAKAPKLDEAVLAEVCGLNLVSAARRRSRYLQITSLKLVHHLNLGMCYIKLEKWDKAVSSCSKASPAPLRFSWRTWTSAFTCRP